MELLETNLISLLTEADIKYVTNNSKLILMLFLVIRRKQEITVK
jgi:hypothetical protein